MSAKRVTSAKLSSTTMVRFQLPFFPISYNLSPLILGKINTNEDLFRSYPVMEDERWCLTNSAKTETSDTLGSLKGELKQAYCESRRLDVDRMGCN